MASKKKEIPVKSPEQFEEDIRLMAYYLWEEKGSTDGGDVEDWIAAELYLNNWIPSSQYQISKATPQGVAFFLFFLKFLSFHKGPFKEVLRKIIPVNSDLSEEHYRF